MATISLVTLGSAFLAGLLSFLSPCILPLTPIYLAQLAGPALSQNQGIDKDGSAGEVSASAGAESRDAKHPPRFARRETLLHASAFVAGFSLAFIALGATASELGAFVSSHATQLRQVGGIVLLLLGLHVAGIVRVPWLDREARFSLAPSLWSNRRGHPLSFLVGLIFGLGWTPCVGPLLAGILLLAAQAATLSTGVLLLAVYSLGLGVPFLVLALAFDQLAPALRKITPYLSLVELGTGILLILVGIVIFFNWLIYVSAWLPLPGFGLP